LTDIRKINDFYYVFDYEYELNSNIMKEFPYKIEIFFGMYNAMNLNCKVSNFCAERNIVVACEAPCIDEIYYGSNFYYFKDKIS